MRKILWAAVLTILCLPGIAFVFFRGQTMDLYWLAPVGWRTLWKLAEFYTGSGVKFIVAVLLAIVGVWGLRTMITDAHSSRRWYAVLLLNWIGFPIAFAFLASLHRNVFSYKYLLICLPPVLLLIAKGAIVLRREIRWLLVAVMLVAAIGTDISFDRKPREDWRALNLFVAASFQDGDGITFYPPYTRNPFDYYHSRTGPNQLQILAPEVIAGDLTEDVYDEAHPAAMIAGTNAKRIWLVVYGTDKTPPEMAARIQTLIAALPQGYTLRLSRDFHNVRLQLYAPTSP